jgi:hypothetical protein
MEFQLPREPREIMIGAMTVQRFTFGMLVLAGLVSGGCQRQASTANPSPDANNVTQFLAQANENLLKLGNAANEAGWVQDNFITVDTQAISARATENLVNAATDYAKRAAKFPADAGTPDERRQLTVLKNTMTMAGPSDPKKTAELTTITARLAAAYGSGKYCPAGQEGSEGCLDVEAVTKILAENRDTLEKMARALIEREVLDANEIKILVDGKELPPVPPPPSKPDDGVQHVIKPDLQPGRAKGGERPATA